MTQSRKHLVYKTKRAFKVRERLFVLLTMLCIVTAGAVHLAGAENPIIEPQIVLAKEDPNFHVATIATQFFEDNDAAEMIPVIECESRFRHYDADGNVLQNQEGSSAIGVAQILSSKHPDPKIVSRYNKKFDMDMTIDDFDLTSLEGNLGYALVLYKVRGTRDWECGKKFAF
jgi:hypothetical protein